MNIDAKQKWNILILFVGIIVGILLIVPRSVYAKEFDKAFWVEYIDVGQGDAALVQCDGHYMMIDGGPAKESSKVYTILKENGINKIDLMIATHPDEDHTGGLSGALNYAEVGTVLSPVVKYDTKSFNNMLRYINKRGKSITVPKAGDIYKLGDARVFIAGPIYNTTDTNNESIIVVVTYGTTSFMFMGDAEEEEEKSILKKYSTLDCDVLKVGHHGSNDSTSRALLNAVNPQYAVISVGADNSYGHPKQGTLDRLVNGNVCICRTDLQGDIVFYSDGENLTVDTQKNATFEELAKGGEKISENNVASSSIGLVAIPANAKYVLNTNTMKFHYPSCSSVADIYLKNRRDVSMSRDEIISMGYNSCKRCHP